MKSALVRTCGVFFCAYNAGATAELCRQLGYDYFDEHFCSSGSIFGSTFCAANQPNTMEQIWRYDVCGGQLLKWRKLLWGNALDLDYLIRVFQRGARRLNLDALFASEVKVNYVMTDYQTGQPFFVQPSRSNIWTLMRAACAMPHLYPPVCTEYDLMVDGGLSVPCPVRQALDSGFDEVIVVNNKAKDHVCHRADKALCSLAGLALPFELRWLLRSFEARRIETERKLFRDPRVKVIRPQGPLPVHSSFDGNRQRLNATIDRGIADASKFIQSL